MTATVAVVGGGYAGITAAKALDDVADVILIEPRDVFVHNVAALRSVTDPSWIDKLFIPYDKLLTRGQIRKDRAIEVSGTAVKLASGDSIEADYIVLATGSTAPYPANMDVDDAETAKKKLHATHLELERASHVLLLGAGPVGLELAGEIRAAWPSKAVTVIEPRPKLLSSGTFPEEFHAELRRQLDQLGVEVLLGTSLRELPAPEPGVTSAFTVATESGVTITADIWFRCFGTTTNSDCLAADLGAARQANHRIAVTPELRVQGQDNVFAIGDVSDVAELKLAYLAQKHAEVVAANITTLIQGGGELTAYQPDGDAIVLPLGPSGGVVYAPDAGVLGAEVAVGIKGSLYLDLYLELLNQK